MHSTACFSIAKELKKAPSERGLPTESGGGECATKEFYQILLYTHSPSVATATAPSAGSLGLCGLLCQRTDKR